MVSPVHPVIPRSQQKGLHFLHWCTSERSSSPSHLRANVLQHRVNTTQETSQSVSLHCSLCQAVSQLLSCFFLLFVLTYEQFFRDSLWQHTSGYIIPPRMIFDCDYKHFTVSLLPVIPANNVPQGFIVASHDKCWMRLFFQESHCVKSRMWPTSHETTTHFISS